MDQKNAAPHISTRYSGMHDLLVDVATFHRAGGVPVLSEPGVPGKEARARRRKLLTEEYIEAIEALDAIDLAAEFPDQFPQDADSRVERLALLANKLADVVYVAVGAALEFGLPLHVVWAAVQAANMAKVGPDGLIMRRHDGKILKPEGWKKADIASIIRGSGD